MRIVNRGDVVTLFLKTPRHIRAHAAHSDKSDIHKSNATGEEWIVSFFLTHRGERTVPRDKPRCR